MTEYCIELGRQAKFLDPAIPVSEFIGMVARHFSAEIRSAIVVSRPTTIREVLNLLRELQSYVTDPFVTYGMKQNENRPMQPKKEPFSQMGDGARSFNNNNYQERKPHYNNNSPNKQGTSPRGQNNPTGHSSFNDGRGNFHNNGNRGQQYHNNYRRQDFHIHIGQFMPQQWNQIPYWWQNRTWRSKTNSQRYKPYNNRGGKISKWTNNHGNNNYHKNGGGNNNQRVQEARQEPDIFFAK